MPPTILIVDDIKTNRQLLKDHIEILGYTPLLAENGLSALIQVKKQPPDLILLDILMPEMDGREALALLQSDARFKHIPVIMISALDEIETVSECIRNGAIDYLIKPFDPNLLKARMEAALKTKTLHDQEEKYRAQIENYNLTLEDKVRERTAQLEESQREVIYRLGRAAEYKDNETGLHVVRMSHYSALLGEALGMSGEERELLLLASPMHDIGKIGIPDSILLKPGKLNSTEWETMKTHVTIGMEILSEGKSEVIKKAATIAATHHEKWDGSGYPKGLKGEEIPLEGRIVALADVFDALTTERPYKKAWSVDEALALIKSESGKHFDPNIVSQLINILPKILVIKMKFAEDDSPDSSH
ncbi:MAG: response regulator [Nitrospinae bacterium]|nr:response regulator [Nitrospinota bacterium]